MFGVFRITHSLNKGEQTVNEKLWKRRKKNVEEGKDLPKEHVYH